MRKSFRITGALALLLLLPGCYHAVINTGRPASGQTIEKQWAHSFLYGLVPPNVVETASECPSGVAKVETQHSFLNMVAYILTGGIYSPMMITVSCASEAGGTGASASAAMPSGAFDADAASREASREAMQAASQWSLENGAPAYVRFR